MPKNTQDNIYEEVEKHIHNEIVKINDIGLAMWENSIVNLVHTCISKAIQDERKRIVEIVEKMKITVSFSPPFTEEDFKRKGIAEKIHNSALEDLLAKIMEE
jgi:hypothetical protein